MALRNLSNRTWIKSKTIGIFFAALALMISPFIALKIPAAFALGATDIYTVNELRTAIENQADGQTWNIHPGTYGLSAFTTITTQGQTGWYFPITANNLTINGVGNPTIYGQGYVANGNWSTQDFIAVFGHNVTINGLTLMPKIEPNKTIEVIGSDFTLTNTTITPNTIDTASYASDPDPTDKDWGGSLYFNGAGNHTIQNVTINNAGVSFRYSPSGTHINFTNVKIVDTTNAGWINTYRYSSGFNNSGNSITGSPSVEYHVNSTLNNLDNVLTNLHAGDTLVLDSNIAPSKQVTITVPVTINGNGHTISPNFAKTDNDNNSALGIQADNVTIKNLIEDGTNGTNLHGINIVGSHNVLLNNVTVKNNDRSGVNVNSSTVTVNNITTMSNGWNGIDVDKSGAVVTVNGVSHHTETVPAIYVDDTSIGQVIDTNHQYGTNNNVLRSGDRVYGLKPGVPTLLSPSNNGYVTTNDFYFDWSDVSGAVEYEFQSSQNPTTVDGILTTGVWNNKANGAPDRNHLTTSQIHSYGASGTWYWQVRAIDASGIKSDWSSTWKMTIDTTAPAAPSNLSWKTSTNKTIANNGVTNVYNGTALWQEATPSDVDHYIYKYWNDIAGNPYKVGSEYTTSTTSMSLSGVFNQGEGVHHFCVAAVDAAGNTSACTAFTVIYDTTAPTITVKAGFVGNLSSKTFSNVSFSLYDAHRVDKYVLNGWTSDFSNNNWSDANFANIKSHLVQGTNTLTLYDEAGNSTSYVFTYDSIAPAVTITGAIRGSDGTYIVTGTSDSTAPVTVLVDGLTVSTVTPVSGIWTATTAILPDGTHTVTASSTDAAGNTGNATPAPYTFVATTPIVQPETNQTPTLGNTTPTNTPQGNNGTGAPAQQLLAVTQPAPDATTDPQAVLGVQDTKSSNTPTTDQSVKGASTTASTDGNAGKLFGLLWYWWLVILAAIIALWWIIAAARRRKQDEN